MVCEACAKKIKQVATIDPYRTKKHNVTTGAITKKPINEHKLLSGKHKLVAANTKCGVCKQPLHQVGQHYCNICAYQKGICSMCGKKVIDVKNLQLRQSVV